MSCDRDLSKAKKDNPKIRGHDLGFTALDILVSLCVLNCQNETFIDTLCHIPRLQLNTLAVVARSSVLTGLPFSALPPSSAI